MSTEVKDTDVVTVPALKLGEMVLKMERLKHENARLKAALEKFAMKCGAKDDEHGVDCPACAPLWALVNGAGLE